MADCIIAICATCKQKLKYDSMIHSHCHTKDCHWMQQRESCETCEQSAMNGVWTSKGVLAMEDPLDLLWSARLGEEDEELLSSQDSSQDSQGRKAGSKLQVHNLNWINYNSPRSQMQQSHGVRLRTRRVPVAVPPFGPLSSVVLRLKQKMTVLHCEHGCHMLSDLFPWINAGKMLVLFSSGSVALLPWMALTERGCCWQKPNLWFFIFAHIFTSLTCFGHMQWLFWCGWGAV